MARHQATRAFGEEADHLVLATLPVLEHAVDDACLQRLAQSGARVFDRRQIDDDGPRFTRLAFVQVSRQRVAPVGVEVLAARVLQPYRLEMGTALATARGKDLYAWWGDTVAQHLNERLADEDEPVVVNLASIEYARAALRPALRARVVDCVFEEQQADGSHKIISFFAKKARGLMARHAILHRVRSVRALRNFSADGYAFDAKASAPDRLVFRRAGLPK